MIFYKLKQNGLFLKIVAAFAYLFFIPFRILNSARRNERGKTFLISLHLLGDTVFSLPTVKYFSRKIGNKLIIACFENSKIIYEKAGIQAEFITFKRNDYFLSGRFPKLDVRKKIRKKKPFRIIDISGGIHSAFTIAGIGAAEIIGMNEEIYKSLYDKFIPLRTAPNLVDKIFDVARIFESGLERKKYSYIPEKINSGKRILFHPFGSWKEKEWDFEKYIALAGKLKIDGFDAVFIWEKGRAGEEKKNLLQESNLELIETNDLEQLFDETEKSFLFIGVDSGPIHIASLLGTSTIAIYGPTNPAFIKPEGKYHFTIQKIIHCSPVGEKHYCDTLAGKTCATLECLRDLTVEEVYEKTIRFIKEALEKKT
ncbi:MAG: glycosyltransferase family 9 protein [Chlorobi bacterium]|nr:glycosyltransferase family 9 protein [Chlorobiota bacterium]